MPKSSHPKALQDVVEGTHTQNTHAHSPAMCQKMSDDHAVIDGISAGERCQRLTRNAYVRYMRGCAIHEGWDDAHVFPGGQERLHIAQVTGGALHI